MDNVIGSAAIVIRPEFAGFAAEVEAGAGAPLTGFQKKAEKSGEEAGSKLSKGFGSKLGGITSALSSVGIPLQTFGGRLDKTAASLAEVEARGSKAGQTFARIGGDVLLGTTAAFVAAGAAGVDLAVKYESVTARIAGASSIPVASAKKITDAFLNTAGSTVYSAKEIGGAFASVAGELATVAGHAYGTAEAMKFMTAAQQLAEGSGSALGSSTEALAKTMLVYHLAATQATSASDVLFEASRQTGMSVESLSSIVDRARGRLGDLAPSLGETAGLVAELSKQGVAGRQAMSVLNGSFTTLTAGGKKTEEMAKTLGLQIFDNNGKFVGLTSVITQLQPKLASLSQEQQLAATKALFGASASKQLLDVILKGPEAYQASITAVSKHGTAEEAARKQSETFEGELKKLKAAAEDLAIKFGQVLLPVLTKLAHGISEGIDWLKKHEAAAKALAIVITTVLGAAIGAFVATKVAAFIDGTQKMLVKLGLLGPATEAAATEMGVAEDTMVTGAETTAAGVDAALIGTGIGVALVALGAAAWLLSKEWDEVMEALETATAAAANVIVEMLNSIIRAYNETAGELLGSVEELGKIHTAKEEEGTAGEENRQLAAEAKKRGIPLKQLERENEAEGTPSDKAIQEAAKKYGIKPETLYGIYGTETTYGKNDATSSTGAMGAFQFEPETAKQLAREGTPYPMTDKPDTKEFREQVIAAAHYLSELIKSTGSLDAALAAYSGHTAGYAQKVAANAQGFSSHNKALERDIAALGEHTKATKAHKAASENAYVSPFSGASNVTHGRIDQGADFSFAGPLAAIGAGTIVKIISDPGGFGKELVEKIEKGARAGQYLYYGLETGATSSITQGTKVRAGQTIAHGRGTGGIELGFASGPGGVPITPFKPGESHEHPTVGGTEFEKFLGTLHKGGLSLETASASFKKASKEIEAAAKAELKKQTADKKAGETELTKLDAAIQSGGVKELTKVVGGAHDAALKRLEKTLHDDHSSVLEKLRKELVKAHEKALEALSKALIKVAEKAAAERMGKEDTIHTDEADAAVKAIEDSTKVTLDKAAEAGKSGAELVAAQAQTHLDEVKAADDASVGAAKLAVDRAEGMGEAAQAAAKQELVTAENSAKVQEATAQQALDLANLAATEAKKQTEADEKRRKEEEEAAAARKKTEEAGAANAAGSFTFYINGADLTPAQLMSEVGWALKTGSLPVAT